MREKKKTPGGDVMRRSGRGLGIFVLLLGFFWMAGLSSQAASQKVYDDAGLLSSAQEKSLTASIEELEQTMGMQAILVTTNDNQGKGTKDYADVFYEETCGIDTDGIAFLIDMDDRQLWISTSGDMRLYLTDARIDSMLDRATPMVGEGRYAEAFSALMEDTLSYYHSGKASTYFYDEDTGEVTYHRSITTGELMAALGIAIAAAVIFLFVVRRKYSVKGEAYAYPYRKKAEIHWGEREDQFLYANVTKRHIPKNPPKSSGGGGGGTSIHTSSGGGSHGGGGRGF